MPLLHTVDGIYDYASFFDKAWSLAQPWQIHPKDKVGICLKNTTETLLAVLGVWLHGGIVILISPSLTPTQKRDRLNMVACHYFITDTLLSLPHNMVSLPFKKDISITPYTQNTSYNENDWLAILFTSGNTGKAKAVVLTIGNIFWNALNINRYFAIKPQDRWLLSLSLYHIAGLSIMFRVIIGGTSMVCPNPKTSFMKPNTDINFSHISLVPTQLSHLISQKKWLDKLKNVNAILLGGEPIPKTLLNQSIQHQLPLYLSYGSTETASHIAISTWLPTSKKTTINSFCEMRLNADKEIEVRGKICFHGYIDTLSNSVYQPFDSEGWYATGDLAEWQNKQLHILGRKDEMFISGGKNIDPKIIENTIKDYPNVAAVRIIPIPDNQYGYRPVAFIQMNNNIPLPEIQTWWSFLEHHIETYQIPDIFLAMPINPSHCPKIAKQYYAHWYKHYHLKLFMKWFPIGWQTLLFYRDAMLFEVIDHIYQKAIYVVSKNRHEIRKWIINHHKNNPKKYIQSTLWHNIPSSYQRNTQETIEIIRLTCEDITQQKNITGVNCTTNEPLPIQLPTQIHKNIRLGIYLDTIQYQQKKIQYGFNNYNFIPMPQNNAIYHVFQWTLSLHELKRCYAIRCLYNDNKHFLGWKVHAMRDNDRIIHYNPLWYIKNDEMNIIENIMHQQKLATLEEIHASSTPKQDKLLAIKDKFQ